eukprot:m.87709 g.87709  ORF g.87709 m.87709 type:complete len:79 (-) comp8791_c4_seq5:77-313(-)
MPPLVNERVLEYAVLLTVDLTEKHTLNAPTSSVFPPINIFQGKPNPLDEQTLLDLFSAKVPISICNKKISTEYNAHLQ